MRCILHRGKKTCPLPYENVVNMGHVTSYTITGLTPGNYYVTVTAYDTGYDASNDIPDTIGIPIDFLGSSL